MDQFLDRRCSIPSDCGFWWTLFWCAFACTQLTHGRDDERTKDICDTVDFILRAKRDKKATLRFFKKVMASSDTPEKVAIDKRGANKAAMDYVNAERKQFIVVRQVKYLKISLSRSTGLSRSLSAL